MANDDGKNNDGKNGQSHEDATYFNYAEVSNAEIVSPTATWQQNMMESGSDSPLAQEMGRRGYEGAARHQQGLSLDPNDRDAAQQSGLQQSHQQSEQSKDTRAYAEQSEAASLAALQKDGQRLSAGHSKDQDQEKSQEQSQQQGKEKSHEQDKTQGR